ncbi:MAG: response regulator [Oscillospiraceae bacterium]|jgi:signal transduction histidine kinase|nr:response regulator [Oscillospiraceae bacterium]
MKNEKLLTTINEYISYMSQEIKTPMSNIIGFSELAMNYVTSPKTKLYLTSILDNSQWLMQVMNDIIDYSMIETGKLELELVPMNPRKLFDTCRTIIAPKARDKGLELTLYSQTIKGKVPLVDQSKILQVLVNLLTYSINSTNKGKVSLQADIIVRDTKSITVHFEIADTSPGMSSEQIKKLFNLPEQDISDNSEDNVKGLGIIIAIKLIELMGGKLHIDSKVGEGSKYLFDLTFDLVETGANELDEDAMGEFKRPIFAGEVLVCEDNQVNRLLMQEHLTRVGLNVVTAKNSKQAFDLVKEREKKNESQFDLIVLDVQMPFSDGLQIAAKIRDKNSNIPIIATSANAMANDRELFAEYGIKDYIPKPFTSQQLWQCLSSNLTVIGRASDSDAEIRYTSDTDKGKFKNYHIADNRNSILLVDDEVQNIATLTNALDEDFRVMAVLGGKEALDIAEKKAPDIILLDIMMPDMDGYEVIAALKANSKTRDIPVIFITGMNEPSAERKGLEMGAVDYISKPFNVATVKLRVENQIRLVNHIRALEERDELKRMLTLNEDLKEHAEHISRAKSEFLSMISHEMLTPMNAIMGMTNIVKREKLSEKSLDCINEIDAASKNMLSMIHDMLDIANIENNIFELKNRKFTTNDLVRGLAQFKTSAFSKNINFSYDIDENIPDTLVGDARRLKQVVKILIGNAIKFTPDGGKVNFSVNMVSEDPEIVTIKFEIKDTGIGIGDKQKKNLFALFEQADSSITRRYGGIGIGLTLAKKIVEMMGGTISVESEQNRGTKFTFTCVFKK